MFYNFSINVFKLSIFKLNPPNKYPSIVGQFFNSSIFFSFALPPYNILLVGNSFLINCRTSSISSFVGINPVPIDQIGSYATISCCFSVSVKPFVAAIISFVITSITLFCSLSSFVSPTHKIGLIDTSNSFLIF